MLVLFLIPYSIQVAALIAENTVLMLLTIFGLQVCECVSVCVCLRVRVSYACVRGLSDKAELKHHEQLVWDHTGHQHTTSHPPPPLGADAHRELFGGVEALLDHIGHEQGQFWLICFTPSEEIGLPLWFCFKPLQLVPPSQISCFFWDGRCV